MVPNCDKHKISRWRKEHAEESSSEEESADDKSGSGSSEESDSDEDVSTFICVIALTG
jgi:hypothetical protein